MEQRRRGYASRYVKTLRKFFSLRICSECSRFLSTRQIGISLYMAAHHITNGNGNAKQECFNVLAAAVIQEDFHVVVQPQEAGGQVRGDRGVEKSCDGPLFPLLRSRAARSSGHAGCRRCRASIRNAGLVSLALIIACRSVSADSFATWQWGCTLGAGSFRPTWPLSPEAKNAHIDRALALELRADPGAFPQRIRRFRIEGKVALRSDREGSDEPALEDNVRNSQDRPAALRATRPA